MDIPHMSEEAAMITDEDGISGETAIVRDVRRFTMDDEIHDLTLGLTPEQVNALVSGLHDKAAARKAVAAASQQRIAEANSRIEFAANFRIDGLTLEAEVSREVFDYWLSRREELGANPWAEEEFWNEMKRDNPEVRVRTVSGRTSVLCGFESEETGEEAAA